MTAAPPKDLTPARLALVAAVAVLAAGAVSVLAGVAEPVIGAVIAALVVVPLWAGLRRWML